MKRIHAPTAILLVRRIDHIEQMIDVDFEGLLVQYDWSEVDELVLAYAVSVHKAQGSEFPVVVLPVVAQHYMMLQRNLLYTAVTRASRLCVLAGERRAIRIAVSNNKVSQRFTALDWRLGEKRRLISVLPHSTENFRKNRMQSKKCFAIRF